MLDCARCGDHLSNRIYTLKDHGISMTTCWDCVETLAQMGIFERGYAE